MVFNKYQSSVEELNLSSYPEEIQEQFWDFINNVPFIRYLVSEDRPYAKDLPKDDNGKIIVDITKPHIFENMDYFRQTALHYQKTGRYTDLRPNPNPNSEYGKWVREEIRRCYYGMVRPSDGEWITGDMYFFLNYWPIMQTKYRKGSKKGERIIDFPEVWDGIYLRYNYIDQAINGGMYNDKGGNNGCEISSRGKAHPYSQIVYLPEGNNIICKSWGEVKIGDTLIGDDGLPTKVINIPYDDYCDVYKITLKDGRVVYSSGNHLWKVWRNHSHCYKVKSTLEMMRDFRIKRKVSSRNPKGLEYNYRIPKNKGAEWNYKEVPIDPYTLGLCLGDGSFRHPKLKNNIYYTSDSKDMLTYKNIVPYEILKLKTDKEYFIRINDAKGILTSLGLYMKKSEDKFIPDLYKYNNRIIRLNILKGLMDSDGFVDSNGVPIIGVSSKRLSDDIAFICRSLGYNCLQSVKKASYKKDGKKIECLDSYVTRIYTSDRIFNLERKNVLISKYTSKYSRSNKDFTTIINIEYSHKEKCKCVTVDNESSCYLIGDFITTHNSKSYTMSAIMGKRFVLGESYEVNRAVKCMATAYQKQYLTADGILNKFQAGIDFLSQNTQFPSKRLKDSLQDMVWRMGYKDLDTGTAKGTLNEVIGVSAKDDPSKVRGKRQNFIVVEEFGSFRNVLELYNIMIPSVQEGDISFGTMYLIGTSGDDESDFQGAQEIVYNPDGYRMYGIPNVYDKEGQGRPKITFFFPGFLNRKGCYDKDGNSDVTKALLEILSDRYRVKYNSTDINSITKTIAEIPITPQEAILRTKGNTFPVTQLNEQLNQLDANPNSYDDVYVGNLLLGSNGEVSFKIGSERPIRDFPLKDNTAKGALEIFQMPEKDLNGKVSNTRYIAGFDPYDNDQADSMSLGSVFVLDLFTDKIVAEYTGRTNYADELYEIVRLLCIFYNCKCLYESNKKGTFSYFSRMNSLHLLADTPEYLREKQLVKYSSFGSNAHPYDEKVYTPDGIKQWGDIKVGDYLYTPHNTITKVVDIPIDEELDIYEIYLKDGRVIQASDNHIWEVWKGSSKVKSRILMTTKEIMKDLGYIRSNKYFESKYYIKCSKGIEFEEKEVPMNPYMLGLMIGDGSMSNKYNCCGNRLTFTSSKEDMKIYMNYLKYNYKYHDDRHCYIEYQGWGNIVKSLKLNGCNSHTKFIPELYKYNSREVRMEILKGLMDSDGTIAKYGSPMYTTVSKQLAEDIMELIRSLGMNCNLRISTNKYGPIYTVIIYTKTIIFRLPRKIIRQVNANLRTRDEYTGIINIKYIGKKKAKCVTIDSEDGLYLINDFVTTHNCKGINASAAINNFANELIKDWLLKEVTVNIEENGEPKEFTTFNLYYIKNRALLKELVLYNPDINVDRVRALGMLMLYREEKMILYQGDLGRSNTKEDYTYLGNDSFFTKNFRIGNKNIINPY